MVVHEYHTIKKHYYAITLEETFHRGSTAPPLK